MKQELFDWNIERLVKIFGTEYYSPATKALIWNTVHDMDEQWFNYKIDFWILNQQLPTTKEIGIAVLAEKKRLWNEKQKREQVQQTDIYKVLQEHAKDTKNPFPKKCMALLDKKLSGEITREEFLLQCEQLDREAAENMQHIIRCTCDNGMVFTTDSKGCRYLNACTKCNDGKQLNLRAMSFPSDKTKNIYVAKEPYEKHNPNWQDKY